MGAARAANETVAVGSLDAILGHYKESFRTKLHEENLGAPDVLMDVFGITPQMKAQASQYWGRELGMCWERLVRQVMRDHAQDVGPALASPSGSPCDFTMGNVAVDTKYRLGSGDSGTLNKLAANSAWLQSKQYQPVMLFLREDSLDSARSKMVRAGWRVLEGQASFDFIQQHTGQDLRAYLLRQCLRPAS